MPQGLPEYTVAELTLEEVFDVDHATSAEAIRRYLAEQT